MALLPELLKDSRASSTVKSYHSGFVRWKNWALSNGLGSKDVLPAKAFHAAFSRCFISKCFRFSTESVFRVFVLGYNGVLSGSGEIKFSYGELQNQLDPLSCSFSNVILFFHEAMKSSLLCLLSCISPVVSMF